MRDLGSFGKSSWLKKKQKKWYFHQDIVNLNPFDSIGYCEEQNGDMLGYVGK